MTLWNAIHTLSIAIFGTLWNAIHTLPIAIVTLRIAVRTLPIAARTLRITIRPLRDEPMVRSATPTRPTNEAHRRQEMERPASDQDRSVIVAGMAV